MRKLFLILSLFVLLLSCGEVDPETGELLRYSYEGKFKGHTLYNVCTLNGNWVYIAVKDNEITSINTVGKGAVHTIIIDGKEMNISEAKKKINDMR